jgi:hypothetical protein
LRHDQGVPTRTWCSGRGSSQYHPCDAIRSPSGTRDPNQSGEGNNAKISHSRFCQTR